MKPLNRIMLERLKEKGISTAETPRLIKDVAAVVMSTPRANADEVNRRLGALGWHGITMDDQTLQMLIAGFEEAGLIGTKPPQTIDDAEGLQRLLDKIYQERGFDFRGYSRTSLTRRISRRLHARSVETYAAYMDILDRDPDEYEPLFDEITITVTRFFRNEAAFKALERILRSTLERKDHRSIRIWSAGCATGQEPYTIVMLLAKVLPDLEGLKIDILATDIDAQALAVAREGSFDDEAVQEVPESWRTRYFNKKRKRYCIRSELKDLITFQQHNIVSDHAFDDLDIIVCRNVLIYFNLGLQMKVVSKFYNSLNDKGYLLLGRYEMLLKEARRKFSCIDFDARLYQKR